MKRILGVVGLWIGLAAGPVQARGLEWTVSARLGGAGLATDTAAEGVGRFGLHTGLVADFLLPMLPGLAPELGYQFSYLPGPAGAHRIEVGAALRPFRFAGKGLDLGELVVEAALGYVRAPTEAGDANWFGFSVGAGFLFRIPALAGLFAGPYLRYEHVVFDGAADPIFLSFGVQVAYGAGREAASAPKPALRREAPVEMAKPELRGQPGDLDGDSVADASDLCPLTAPGTQVDERGCMVLKGKMVFPDVAFAPGSDRLSPKALLALKRLADAVKAQQVPVVVVVWAYAARGEGTDLAARRAKRVAEALARYGLDATRIQAGPVPPGTIDLDRPQGPWWPRRVVFRFKLAQ